MTRDSPRFRDRILGRLSSFGHSVGVSGAPAGTAMYWINQLARLVALLLLCPRECLNLVSALQRTHQSSAWYSITGPRAKFRCAADWDPEHKLAALPWRAPLLAPWNRTYFDLDSAVRRNFVDRICFVFFIGLGDYLYATPAIADIRRRLPGVQLVGYVSSNADGHNAPLVKRLLACNPDIDETLTFAGSPNATNWKNYDYREVIRHEQENPRSIVVPVLYEYDAHCEHRVAEIYRGFCLPLPQPVPSPLIHLPKSATSPALALMASLRPQLGLHAKGLAFLQLDSRSSGYVYPYIADVASALVERGYVVLVAGEADTCDERVFELDPMAIPIEQTFGLLAALKNCGYPVRIVSVTSVFWPASSALGIPNLTMQHRHDPGVGSLWYPNLWVITDRNYQTLPASRQIVCPADKFATSQDGLISYDPDFLLESFDRLSSPAFRDFAQYDTQDRCAG